MFALGLPRWLASCALAFVGCAASGMEMPPGVPPVVRLVPDIQVYPQTFEVLQDARGLLYVGSVDGVLEFDGERWTLIPLDNRESARSLALGADGRVYVGGYNSFGYLESDVAGQTRYRALTPAFARHLQGREYGDVWRIVAAPEGIYFCGLTDLFLWRPEDGEVRYWQHAGRFGAMAHHRGRTLLQFRGEGIKQRDGDDWRLLPATHELTQLIFDLIPTADGALLTTGSDGRWWRLEGESLAPATMPATMPPSSSFEHGVALPQGDIAFASRDGSVVVLAADLRSERRFRIDSGFLSGIGRARDGLVVGANEAVFHLTWPAELSMLGAEQGLRGSLYAVQRWNDELLVFSSAGVFRADHDADEGTMFRRWARWREVSAYDLHPIDARRAVLAAAHQLYLLRERDTLPISAELVYPRLLEASRFVPDRIFVGSENGLRLIEADADAVVLSPQLPAGTALRVTSLLETAHGTIWVGSERHGVWRYRLRDDGGIDELRRFGSEEGLNYGPVPVANVFADEDGELLVATERGFYRYEGERFVADDMDGLAPLRADDELLTPIHVAARGAWAYGERRVLRRAPGQSWRELDARALMRGALVGHHLGTDGEPGFIGNKVLLQYRDAAAAVATPAPQVVLRSVVRQWPDGRREGLPLPAATLPVLEEGDFGIGFQFALPHLDPANAAMYQGRLRGYEENYSDWSTSRGYLYSRLRPGDYVLEVRARDARGGISEIPPYALRIEPRWYASVGARTLWSVLAAGLLAWLAQWLVGRRTRRLAEQTARLEAMVDARTLELAAANRRLEMMANIDGLTGIPNRRRLDEYLDAVWRQCAERGRPLALVAIDVDRFKDYNDRRGHLAGDELLRALAQRLTLCLRRNEDMVARYGGEEFLVVLPGAAQEVALELAETMRREVEQSTLGSTISLGVAAAVPDGDADYSGLLARADAALYAAKSGGRNRVAAATFPTRA
jgi:diguanylate cyclase (GGDEF)-like protein